MLYDPKWEVQADSETKRTLSVARGLISIPDSWCRQYTDGHAICAVHAIQLATKIVTGEFRGDLENAAVTVLGAAMGISPPGTGVQEGRWNDTHTHAEVMAAFDRAIATA